MASTNKTTHYELSQYVGSDKPTYLTDYNQDMSRIDAGIYGAKSLADVNESAIGTLANLSTTAKNDLVSAINEVDGDVATNTANISTNTSNISTNSTNIGNLSNLTTASKTNLVSAINEVDANSDSNANKIGDLTNLTTDAKSNLVGAINEVDALINNFNLTTFVTPTLTIRRTSDGTDPGVTATNNTIKIAKNSNGSLFKFYGSVQFNGQDYKGELIYRFSNTGLPAVDEAYTISNACIGFLDDGTSLNMRVRDIVYQTNGDITMTYTIGVAQKEFVYIPNCLYFNSNFGDVPTPE